MKRASPPGEFEDDLVSIITPAYRTAHLIGDTIRSVIAQTYPRWEMLIVEDCSPDDTGQVVRRWTGVDSRVKLIALERNGGPAAARNAALERARGRWIAFLDSDDLWLPRKLETSIAWAKAQRSPLVYTGYRRMSADGKRVGRAINVPKSLTYRQLLGNTAIATSTVLVDRSVAGDFRMRQTYYDDFDGWLRILKGGHRAAGLNEDLMRYRVLSGSVSRNKIRSSLQVWRAYRKLERLSLVRSAWCFFRYAMHNLMKYSRF
ncbi:MAG: glycosyltransferase family 2 protein [Euryarchaeota archaeon]|nr:glycosyltransferase family 2 protein [Euryarchaeota archaeon]